METIGNITDKVVQKYIKNKRTDSYYCPICFIVNPEKVSIYDVYPFDMGAFDAEKYSDFFPRGVKLKNHELYGGLETIQSYIVVMFDNNENCIEGKCVQSGYDLAEINILINVCSISTFID